jgi:hypothetical protein
MYIRDEGKMKNIIKRPKRLVLEVSDEFHRAIKLHALENDFESVSSFLMWCIQRGLPCKNNQPLTKE